jgi:hypothetical protein
MRREVRQEEKEEDSRREKERDDGSLTSEVVCFDFILSEEPSVVPTHLSQQIREIFLRRLATLLGKVQ